MDAPSNKKQKTEANEVASELKKAPTSDVFPFEKLERELQSHILGFLVCPPKDVSQENTSPFIKRLGRKHPLFQDIGNMTRVCLEWRQLVSELVNQYNGAADIITASKLADLKSRVAKIDLSSIKTDFIKEIRERWGDEEVMLPYGEPTSALNFIVIHESGCPLFSLDTAYGKFAEEVAELYKTFLVVKCVEALVANAQDRASESSNEAILAWKEKCCPSKLIDLFWHAHMLSPKKYWEDCNSLINNIVDHDASYISPKAQEGSDYKSKVGQLYKFEYISAQMFMRHANPIMAIKDVFPVGYIAESIVEEMEELDMDAECG